MIPPKPPSHRKITIHWMQPSVRRLRAATIQAKAAAGAAGPVAVETAAQVRIAVPPNRPHVMVDNGEQ